MTPESRATTALHAGADERRLGAQQRHRLALHVRAHEGAVRVVVLEERDQRRRDRDELVRRHVHELDLLGPHHRELAADAGRHEVGGEVALGVDAARSPARSCAPPPRGRRGRRSRR